MSSSSSSSSSSIETDGSWSELLGDDAIVGRSSDSSLHFAAGDDGRPSYNSDGSGNDRISMNSMRSDDDDSSSGSATHAARPRRQRQPQPQQRQQQRPRIAAAVGSASNNGTYRGKPSNRFLDEVKGDIFLLGLFLLGVFTTIGIVMWSGSVSSPLGALIVTCVFGTLLFISFLVWGIVGEKIGIGFFAGPLVAIAVSVLVLGIGVTACVRYSAAIAFEDMLLDDAVLENLVPDEHVAYRFRHAKTGVLYERAVFRPAVVATDCDETSAGRQGPDQDILKCRATCVAPFGNLDDAASNSAPVLAWAGCSFLYGAEIEKFSTLDPGRISCKALCGPDRQPSSLNALNHAGFKFWEITGSSWESTRDSSNQVVGMLMSEDAGPFGLREENKTSSRIWNHIREVAAQHSIALALEIWGKGHSFEPVNQLVRIVVAAEPQPLVIFFGESSLFSFYESSMAVFLAVLYASSTLAFLVFVGVWAHHCRRQRRC